MKVMMKMFRNRFRHSSAAKGFGRCFAVAAIFSLIVALVPVSGFAEPARPAHRSSSSYHAAKNSGAKEYICKGLPCSTASLETARAKSRGTTQQLDQMEKQTSNTMRSKPDPTNSRNTTTVYRPAPKRDAEKQSTINFSYRAPATGTGGSANWAKAKQGRD
ncbi:MAG: hypothetical protein WBX38_18105 [Candidatus Sulfotelmatobacter sp.]